MAESAMEILERLEKAGAPEEAPPPPKPAAKKENEAPSTSIAPAIQAAGSAYGMIPEGVKPEAKTALEAAAGYGTGKVLRAALPQEKVFGTPEYTQAQNAMASDRAAVDPMQRAAGAAQGVLEGSVDQHKAVSQSLADNLAKAQQEHKLRESMLNRAAQEHAYAQTLNGEDLHNKLNPLPTGIPGAAAIQPEPRGGAATANYNVKFGATPEEANRVPSMSAMQQEKIPKIQKASEFGKTFEKYGNSPLLVNAQGEGRDVLQARANAAAAGTAEVNQAAAQREAQRAEIERQIARKKAEAKMAYDNAQREHAATQKALADAEKEARKHANTAPITPAETARQQQIIAENQALQDRVKANAPSTAGRVLRSIGTKILPRFAPGFGSAMAIPEAELARKDFEAKQYARMLAHGLGSAGAAAQATGNPLLMGIGDIAQLPSAALAGYDTYKELAGEK